MLMVFLSIAMLCLTQANTGCLLVISQTSGGSSLRATPQLNPRVWLRQERSCVVSSHIRDPQAVAGSQALPLLQDATAQRAMPIPTRDINSLAVASNAIREQLEVFTRQRGFIEDSAVVVGEFLSIIDPLITRIDSLEALIIQLVPAGYGGMDLSTPTAFNVLVGWSTLPYDGVNPIVERGVSMNPAGDDFTIDVAGVWQITANMNLEGFTPSASSGRTYFIRLFNVTASLAGSSIAVGVARNQEDTFISVTAILDIPQAEEGNTFRIEAGGGDAITGGTLDFNTVALVHVSELDALL